MAGRIKEAELEKRREKARALRYKRPLARDMNMDHIQTVMWDILEDSGEIQWMDIDTLAELLDDEEDAYEFRMEFSTLVADTERFQEDLQELGDRGEAFNELFPAAGADFFGGYIGYDEFEQDYFGLNQIEYSWAEQEAEKRISRMTKKELLETVGLCLKIYSSFVALQYRYDCLSSALDIIKGEMAERLKVIREIEELYREAEQASNHFEYGYVDEVKRLDKILAELPQECWL